MSMARLIDADALERSFLDVMAPDVPTYLNVITGMIKAMPTVDAESVRRGRWVTEWISVKDRLPNVGQIVLAFGKRSATTGMFQGVNKRNELWWWKEHTIKYVSHWMPLPEPPKEDDDETD